MDKPALQNFVNNLVCCDIRGISLHVFVNIYTATFPPRPVWRAVDRHSGMAKGRSCPSDPLRNGLGGENLVQLGCVEGEVLLHDRACTVSTGFSRSVRNGKRRKLPKRCRWVISFSNRRVKKHISRHKSRCKARSICLSDLRMAPGAEKRAKVPTPESSLGAPEGVPRSQKVLRSFRFLKPWGSGPKAA